MYVPRERNSYCFKRYIPFLSLNLRMITRWTPFSKTECRYRRILQEICRQSSLFVKSFYIYSILFEIKRNFFDNFHHHFYFFVRSFFLDFIFFSGSSGTTRYSCVNILFFLYHYFLSPIYSRFTNLLNSLCTTSIFKKSARSSTIFHEHITHNIYIHTSTFIILFLLYL